MTVAAQLLRRGGDRLGIVSFERGDRQRVDEDACGEVRAEPSNEGVGHYVGQAPPGLVLPDDVGAELSLAEAEAAEHPVRVAAERSEGPFHL